VIWRLQPTTHSLPIPRARAANVMLVSGANLASLLGSLRIIPRLKEMGFEVHEQVSVVSLLYP
jgi:hypothetical protein